MLKEFRGLELAIWDTAGMEKYAPLSSFYSRDAHAAVIAYDVTERSTFDNIAKYWDVLKNARPDCRVVVIGCKADLVEAAPETCQVPPEEGRKLARERHALRFYETSAKNGQNVHAVFDALCRDIAPEKYDERGAASAGGTVRLGDEPGAAVSTSARAASGGCC